MSGFRHLKPRGTVQALVACLVLWVPLISAGIQVVFDGTRDFFARWVISAAIGDTVCLLCFGGCIVGVTLVRRIASARAEAEAGAGAGAGAGADTNAGGAPLKKRGAAFYLGISALLMPCALPVGFVVGGYVARLLGRSYHPGLGSYREGLGYGAIICAIFFLQWARVEARDRVRDLENANLKAQLAALTAEMNPHMLFNALNTIASLIHSDPDKAEETVIELAEVYRGVLRASGGRSGGGSGDGAQPSTHSLTDEIRLCEAYLRVERARFGERLRIDIAIAPDVAEDAKALQVPMLILQPLIENAVKHGISPRASGGAITVRVARADAEDSGERERPANSSGSSSSIRGNGRADDLHVTIDDDGIGFGKSNATDGNGRALANCKERLRLTYGSDAASLTVAPRTDADGTRALMVLPVK